MPRGQYDRSKARTAGAEKVTGGGGQVKVEPVDFFNVPRYRLGEQIEALTAEVEACKQLLAKDDGGNVKELGKLAETIAELKGALLAAAGGKVKKARAPYGSKKKAAQA